VNHRKIRSNPQTVPAQAQQQGTSLWHNMRRLRALYNLAKIAIQKAARNIAQSPDGMRLRALITRWLKDPLAGVAVLLAGTILLTLFIVVLDHLIPTPLPNPGLVYLPLVAMLAYHWGWRHAAVAGILELGCVYYFFIPPEDVLLKPLEPQGAEQIVTLAAVTSFVLALVQLARARRSSAEREAGRFAALNQVGTALMSELDESRLLHLIAQTARDLTRAEFAAFTLRPVDELGQPLVPAEGSRFHLAAVVGVSKEQEVLLRQMPLGGEGLLAPIFRQGVPVLVPDALAAVHHISDQEAPDGSKEAHQQAARRAAFAYAHGLEPETGLRAVGIPRGHPVVRSFLGAPLLDHAGQVRGGLLLGHTEPGIFTTEDRALLVGLAAQAAVALENARLYRAAQAQAQELDATFESIADGVVVVDRKGQIVRENSAARRLYTALKDNPDSVHILEALLHAPAAHALAGMADTGTSVTIPDTLGESREYIVNASPLRLPPPPVAEPGSASGQRKGNLAENTISGAVIIWHDVTETRRLLAERRARAEAEARRALLQLVIDELPSGIYLVRGHDARLVLSNRAAAEVWGAPWLEGQAMEAFLATSGIRIFREDGRPLPLAEFATLQALHTGKAVRHQQAIIRHCDGTMLPVLVNAVAINPQVLLWPLAGRGDENGSTAEPAALVVHQDVTALKEAERLKDEFIGIAAHELRTPIAALKGFVEMLITQTARGKGPRLADWQEEAIADIDQATARLVELIDDLLDATRLQAGRLQIHPEPVDLAALAQRVATRLQVMTERHTISVHANSEYVVINADPRRIEQVISNLISNAIKYSPNGGNIDISVDTEMQTGMAMLRVHDQGIGIPAQQQAHIFGRFARADNARAFGIQGTGLGLYLSRELVERHGGRIWFESVEGQGSTFFVTLPLVSKEELHAAAET
jgi:two-component system phosphate regulon sensor histidine kinase PhoR